MKPPTDRKTKQSLDYTNPEQVVNFRDVGEFINMIAGFRVIKEGRLYRGGTINYIEDPNVIGGPNTIFCLQKGPDPELDDIVNVHFPISNDYEKYETKTPEVRRWLRQVIKTVEAGVEYPLYVHCLSGRDRTGVVIACLLKILGVNEEHILEEYYLSIGTEGRQHIHLTLEGIRDIEVYLKGINLDRVRMQLLG